MDDMSTFEHQVAREVVREAGPEPRFDAMAISRSVTSQSPRWRFESMFSATKFVVAGVIVALFGGFLLAGVLTQQQSEEPLPVGASASPEPTPAHRVRLPAVLPGDVRSGTLDTALGAVRWAHLEEGPDGLPWRMRPLPTGDGFITVGSSPTDRRVRVWRSPDLVEWTPETLTIDAEYPRLVLSGGTYWLSAEESRGLWRSEDTVTWEQVDLSGLASPFPEGLDVRISISPLADLVGAGDTAAVRVDFWPDHAASYLGLPDLEDTDWWLESVEPGVYEATGRWGSTRGVRVHTRLRFEEIEAGLRVIDADDGSELARLDGAGMDLIDGWVASGGPWRISELAVIEDDTPVLLERPWSPEHDMDMYGTTTGFLAHGRRPDSDLISVWHSDDGATWSESEPLGDDPGEPTSAADVRIDAHGGPLLVTWTGRQWTTPDGISWQESEYPEPLLSPELEQASAHVSGGWLMLSRDELSTWSDSDAERATVDVAELGIGPFADGWETAEAAQEFGTDSSVEASELYAISPDTVVYQIGIPEDPSIGPLGLWILTFDDLPR